MPCPAIKVCHPFGNPNSYNAAVGLLESGLLDSFYTTLYNPLSSRRRCHPELPRQKVRTKAPRELLRLTKKFVFPRQFQSSASRWNDATATNFDDWTSTQVKQDDIVYCYEDSAARTFRIAAQKSATKIYELPILHYRHMRTLFEQTSERYPGIGRFFETFREPEEKLERKDQEIFLADIIITPTQAVANSIRHYLQPKAQFLVLPYGADVLAPAKIWRHQTSNAPLRLLFAGTLGPRKGLHILLDALGEIPSHSYELFLAGSWSLGFREWITQKFPIPYTWLGHLNRSELASQYLEADLFVFPSLAEGFALVSLEAMAAGIPAIISDLPGPQYFITQGKQGSIVPAGCAASLRSAIRTALDSRDQLPEMGGAARKLAESLSWRNYRRNLVSQLSPLLGKSYA